METCLREAFVAGYERLLAWTDLLDRINVFPVADGDTGRNLKISLLPLGRMDQDAETIGRDLVLDATGNSGNIAAAFFTEMIKAETRADLAGGAANGSARAFQAVADPQPGSMLTIYDELAAGGTEAWEHLHSGTTLKVLLDRLAAAVETTARTLPSLKAANVVDAGALGMFIYLEAFLNTLAADRREYCDISRRFAGKLVVKADYAPVDDADAVCVSTIVRPDGSGVAVGENLKSWADSVVVGVRNDCVKVHLHTRRPEATRRRMARLGEVLEWSEEKIETDSPRVDAGRQSVHILTDAAGAMTPEDAEHLGVTLLDSCIVMDGRKYPETLLDPETVYAAMAQGVRVSTAQSSLFQRVQAYQSAVSRHEEVLYLCVGSAYTGNYAGARNFADHDGDGRRLTVLDTGAASGRLGLIARQTALSARENFSMAALLALARNAMDQSREYIFLDQLKYLAAGGRISKSSGFFGDLLGIKPIVTPGPEGAVKVGTARSRKDQLAFALDKLRGDFQANDRTVILLQYSDNQPWVREEALPRIQALLPRAETLLRPLSLTSGAHMGPGTWSLAYLPDATGRG